MKGVGNTQCGHRNEGKTCSELGLESACCNKFGRCSNDAKSCLKENGCQSGPCKTAEPRFQAEEPKAVVKSENSDADDDTNVVVKTISVPVPLCKNCAKKSEESSEESSEGSEESSEASKEAIKKKIENAEEESKALKEGCVKDNGGCPRGFHKDEKKEAGGAATKGENSENSENSEASEASAEKVAEKVAEKAAIGESSEESSEESSDSESTKEAKAEVGAQAAKAAAVAGDNPDVKNAIAAIKKATKDGEETAQKIIGDAVKAATAIREKKNGFQAKAKVKTVLVDIPSKGTTRTSKLHVALKDRKMEKSINPIKF